MPTKKIACRYHPTTIVIIDDDESFLKSMSLHLGHDIPCITFKNPKEALEFLNESYQSDSYLNRCISHTPENVPSKRNIQVDIQPIASEIYNPDRFNEISVIIVDQMMPGLKGLELCGQLTNASFKKILLTGRATTEDIIKGFNQGIINKYIAKDADNLTQQIKDGVRELQQEYFNELSNTVINSLADSETAGSCLSDPVFVEFFNEFLNEHEIVEYSLTDTEGSFLLLDAAGKPFILAVKDEDAMEAARDMARFSKKPPSDDVLQKIEKNECIVYFHADDNLVLEPSDWESRGLLFPAKKLVGKNKTYYYAIINDLKPYAFSFDRVVPFNTFLDGL